MLWTSRKKFQSLKGALGTKPQFVDIAFKDNNGSELCVKQEDAKQNATFLAASLVGKAVPHWEEETT